MLHEGLVDLTIERVLYVPVLLGCDVCRVEVLRKSAVFMIRTGRNSELVGGVKIGQSQVGGGWRQFPGLGEVQPTKALKSLGSEVDTVIDGACW